ncbi:MAG: hypothetical protein DRG76_12265 [Deltaproteobacteria bacterium]|nr:MAG: hypothetical protein DRG76_12265 [Deltaproteobacteria bacterium]
MPAHLSITDPPEKVDRIEVGPTGSPIEPKGRGRQMIISLMLAIAVIAGFLIYDYHNEFRVMKKIKWAFFTPSEKKQRKWSLPYQGRS